MMFVAYIVTISCFMFMLSYAIFGAFGSGKEFFNHVSDSLIGGNKGAPLIALALPLLTASSILSLLHVVSKPSSSTTRIRRPRIFPSAINGDGNYDLYSAIFIFIPFIMFTIGSIVRHFSNDEISIFANLHNLFSTRFYNENEEEINLIVKRVANSFAMGAMILFPFFLVPVSKHGPIIKFFGWDPARVLRLHIWSGRLIVFGSLAHGVLHLIRWTKLFGEQMRAFLLPPKQCWLPYHQHEEEIDLKCQYADSDCSCYNHFLYLTGFIGTLALFILLFTSSNWVRRRFYDFFYMSHVILAPLFLLMVILHYNRAMLFISPALIYYFIASMPVLQQRQSSPGGVAIESVECLGSGPNKCISLTISATEETVASFLPGYYVQMLVPSISSVSHPFTINRVPGMNDRLRIIFRTSGQFTNALAEQLRSGKRPTIHIDGYHGSPERMHQLLKHESTVLFAGGIGITPYLSLLSSLVTTLSSEDTDDIQHGEEEYEFRSRRVVLHWSCRDMELIRYCQTHYFEPLKKQASMLRGCDIEINIHQTCSSSTATPCDPTTEFSSIQAPSTLQEAIDYEPNGRPFEQSCLSPSHTVVGNIPHFVAHVSTTVIGLAAVWYLTSNFQSSTSITERAVAPLLITILAYVMSKLVMILQRVVVSSSPSNTKKSSSLSKQKLVATNILNESSHLLCRHDSSATCSTSCTTLDTYCSSSESDDDEEAPSEITILHHQQGQRPNVSNLLKDETNFNDLSSMGVFCCGPTAMAQTIYDFAHQHQHSSTAPSSDPIIQVYDETFLM